MKILFAHCRPGEELLHTLNDHGLTLLFCEELAEGPGDADLLIWKPRSVQELPQLRSFRTEAMWVALVIPDSWLQDPAILNALLAEQAKDDVWLESQWEAGFWIGIQRAVQTQTAKRHYDSLVASSNALVQQAEQSQDLTTDIHRKFYPRFSPNVAGVEVFSKYFPASGPGGDYFDIFEFGDKRRFALLLADAASHRVAATLLSILLRIRLQEMRNEFTDPASFVDHLNQAILSEQPAPLGSLKLLYAVFDRGTLVLELTSAGGVPAWLWRKNKIAPVALNINPALPQNDLTWQTTKVPLQPGDRVLLFSDGLERALGGTAELETSLNALGDIEDGLDLRNHLVAQVATASQNRPLADDLTFILMAIDEKALFLRASKP